MTSSTSTTQNNTYHKIPSPLSNKSNNQNIQTYDDDDEPDGPKLQQKASNLIKLNERYSVVKQTATVSDMLPLLHSLHTKHVVAGGTVPSNINLSAHDVLVLDLTTSLPTPVRLTETEDESSLNLNSGFVILSDAEEDEEKCIVCCTKTMDEIKDDNIPLSAEAEIFSEPVYVHSENVAESDDNSSIFHSELQQLILDSQNMKEFHKESTEHSTNDVMMKGTLFLKTQLDKIRKVVESTMKKIEQEKLNYNNNNISNLYSIQENMNEIQDILEDANKINKKIMKQFRNIVKENNVLKFFKKLSKNKIKTYEDLFRSQSQHNSPSSKILPDINNIMSSSLPQQQQMAHKSRMLPLKVPQIHQNISSNLELPPPYNHFLLPLTHPRYANINHRQPEQKSNNRNYCLRQSTTENTPEPDLNSENLPNNEFICNTSSSPITNFRYTLNDKILAIERARNTTLVFENKQLRIRLYQKNIVNENTDEITIATLNNMHCFAAAGNGWKAFECKNILSNMFDDLEADFLKLKFQISSAAEVYDTRLLFSKLMTRKWEHMTKEAMMHSHKIQLQMKIIEICKKTPKKLREQFVHRFSTCLNLFTFDARMIFSQFVCKHSSLMFKKESLHGQLFHQSIELKYDESPAIIANIPLIKKVESVYLKFFNDHESIMAITHQCISNILDFYSKLFSIKDIASVENTDNINIIALAAARINILCCLQIASMVDYNNIDCELYFLNFFCFISSGYALLLYNIVNNEKKFFNLLAFVIFHHPLQNVKRKNISVNKKYSGSNTNFPTQESLMEKINIEFGEQNNVALAHLLNDYQNNFGKEKSIERLLNMQVLREQLLVKENIELKKQQRLMAQNVYKNNVPSTTFKPPNESTPVVNSGNGFLAQLFQMF